MVFGKAKKKLRDIRTLRMYRAKLEAEQKIYTQTAETYSDTDRKSRCLAVGECCIQTLEAVGALSLQHSLVPGTLEYMINQEKVRDDTGKKGFRYQVSYMVRANEPAYTEEQIRQEIEKLAEKLKIETQELFAEEEDDEDDNETP